MAIMSSVFGGEPQGSSPIEDTSDPTLDAQGTSPIEDTGDPDPGAQGAAATAGGTADPAAAPDGDAGGGFGTAAFDAGDKPAAEGSTDDGTAPPLIGIPLDGGEPVALDG